MISRESITGRDGKLILAAILIVGLANVLLGAAIGFTGEAKIFLAGLAGIVLLAAIVARAEITMPILLFVWGFARGFLESSDMVLGSVLGQTLTASRALGVLITVGIVLNLVLRQSWAELLKDRLVVLYGFFSLWVTVNAILLGVSTTESIVFLVRYFSGAAILAIYYVSLSDEKGFRRSARWMAASGSIAGLITISQYLLSRWAPGLAAQLFAWGTVITPGTSLVDRAIGSAGGPFVTAVLLLTPLAYALYLWQTAEGPRQKRWYAVAILVMSLAIFATVTRTALVALLFLLGSWFLLHMRRGQGRLTTLGLVVLGVVAGVLLIGTESIVGRTSDLLFTAQTSLSSTAFASGRGVVWLTILSAFADLSPFGWLLGGGLGFSIQATVGALFKPQQPHNEYLWLLGDLGLIGLGLYITFAVAVWLRIRKWSKGHRHLPTLWEGVFAFQLLFLAYHLLVGNFWNFTGNVSGTWFYLAFLGSVLGITRRRLSELSSHNQEGT